MKKFFHMVFISLLTAFVMAGCSSGGGSTENTDSTSIETLLVQENAYAKQFVASSVDYAEAQNELLELLETNNLADTGTVMTAEELIDYVGEANIVALQEEMDLLIDGKLVPTSDEMLLLHERLVTTDELVEALLTGTSEEAQLGLGLLVAGGLILTTVGLGVACHNEIAKLRNACYLEVEQTFVITEPDPTALDISLNDIKITAGKLECTVYNFIPGIAECADDAAIAVGTTAASAATGVLEWKITQFVIDAYSGVSSGLSINELVGVEGTCSTEEQQSPVYRIADLTYYAGELPTYNMTYVGTSEDGKFLIPEGEWSFMLFKDGYARAYSECVSISGDESVIEQNVTMVSIDNVTETAIDNDGDGYTEEEGDCNDANINIFPGAAEVCNDGIDNDCNAAIDCADGSCIGEAVCQGDPGDLSTTLALTVSIPGYNNSFVPELAYTVLANVDDGSYIYPSVAAFSDVANLLNSDLFLMIFSNALPGPGTYTVSELDPSEGGKALIAFSTPEIVDEDGGGAVAFTAVAGTVTLENYGVTNGDRLKGSLSVSVEGKQDLCDDLACNETSVNIISGTITGVFDGVILQSP